MPMGRGQTCLLLGTVFFLVPVAIINIRMAGLSLYARQDAIAQIEEDNVVAKPVAGSDFLQRPVGENAENLLSRPAPLHEAASADQPDASCARKRIAAKAWYEGKGVIYFQHPHNAGGTSFCFLLRQSPITRYDENPYNNCLTTLSGKSVMRGPPLNWTLEKAQLHLSKVKSNIFSNEDRAYPPWLDPFTGALPETWTLVTILRHPVKRVFAHYDFEHIQKRHGISLEKWVNRSTHMTSNHYVRVFAGVNPDAELVKEKGLAGVGQNWAYQGNLPGPPVGREHLERAKRLLSEFSVVMILEWYTETAPLLKRYLNCSVTDLRAKHYEGEAGRQPKKRHMSTDTYAFIADANRLDLELYAYGKQLAMANIQRNYLRSDRELPC